MDRRPKDTYRLMSEMFDDIFEELFGIKLRSESMFASREYSRTSEYGTTYIIFVKGNYDAYTSEKIQDLYVDIANKSVFDSVLWDYKKKDYVVLGRGDDEKEKISELYDMFTSSGNNTQDTIRGLSEIHPEFQSAAKKMIDLIEQGIKEVIKKSYELDDGTGKNRNNELMFAIHDSARKYYAINASWLRRNTPAQDRINVDEVSPKELLAYLEDNIRNKWNICWYYCCPWNRRSCRTNRTCWNYLVNTPKNSVVT